jgi:hypothetical protein
LAQANLTRNTFSLVMARLTRLVVSAYRNHIRCLIAKIVLRLILRLRQRLRLAGQ